MNSRSRVVLAAVSGTIALGCLSTAVAVFGSHVVAGGDTAHKSNISGRAAASGLQNPLSTPVVVPVAGVTVSHISIPDIGVSANTQLLSLNSAGALLPPTNFVDAGWYSAGVLPGQIGPAIIAGHIDSGVAPAVFARLDEVKPGSRILVTLSTGRSLAFVVKTSIESAKAEFPQSTVYGNTPDAELRVITCGGVFNPATGHYLDNIVVFATLVS